jgi:hypothetical protein
MSASSPTREAAAAMADDSVFTPTIERFTASSTLLAERDWSEVMSTVTSEEHFAVAVVDDLLTPVAAGEIRRQLIEGEGWQVPDWGPRYQGLANKYLVNARPICPSVTRLAVELQAALAPVLGQLELVSHWAISCCQDQGIRVHADNAAYVVNVWLTPDRHNREPGLGGLTFFDVRRGPDMRYPDFVQHDLCVRYIEQNTDGMRMQVPFRYNRAVIFDARIMHTSQLIHFAEGRAAQRLNLALAYDDPAELARRTDRRRIPG